MRPTAAWTGIDSARGLAIETTTGGLGMNIRHALGRHLYGCGALTAAAVLASAGIALGSSAIKGASYSGYYKGMPTDTISFTVSSSGKKVMDLYVSTPFKCSGGCGGVESPSGGSAPISKNGKFEATMKLMEPGSTKSYGSDKVTGTFLKHGTAKGKVTSHFNKGSSGETVSWTATS